MVPAVQYTGVGGGDSVSAAVPRTLWVRLGLAFTGLGALAWWLDASIAPDAWWLHGMWCFVGLAVAFSTLVKMFRVPFKVVLCEHRLMFLASFSLYFLFGALLLAIGPANQIDDSLRYYPITARDAMRVNAINGLGLGVALLTSWASSGRWLGTSARRAAALLSGVPASLAITLFLVVGAAAYVYVLSFDLEFHEGVVPGIVRALAKLSLAAILLAAGSRGRGEHWLRAFSIALTLILVVGGTLQFNKTEVLIAIAALTAGLSLRFSSRWMVPAGLTLVVVVYLVLGSLAMAGRMAVVYEGVRTLPERWDIVYDEWSRLLNPTDAERYGSWARLSYTVPQAAALDLWDDGRGGDGFALIGWVLVPRVLAEDKPEITRTGRDFNDKIIGREGASSTGQGIFASGYYHGGWVGLVLASVLCGWIIAQTTAIARAIVNADAQLLYPFCLLGLYIAFRIDGDFVSDYVGAFVFILYPILGLGLISSAARVPIHRPPAPAG